MRNMSDVHSTGTETEARRLLGKTSSIWEDNINTDLKETGCEYVDWIYLAQARHQWRVLVNMAINICI